MIKVGAKAFVCGRRTQPDSLATSPESRPKAMVPLQPFKILPSEEFVTNTRKPVTPKGVVATRV